MEKVVLELEQYEHPFFEFSVEESTSGVTIRVRSKVAGVHSPEYSFNVSEREIDHSQFRWSFQGLLYGNLNDYMVELFNRLPGDPSNS